MRLEGEEGWEEHQKPPRRLKQEIKGRFEFRIQPAGCRDSQVEGRAAKGAHLFIQQTSVEPLACAVVGRQVKGP